MARAALSLPPEMPRMCRTEVLPTGCLSFKVVDCALLCELRFLLDHQRLCELGEEHLGTLVAQSCARERQCVVYELCKFVVGMLVSPNDGCMIGAIGKRHCDPDRIEWSTGNLRLREVQTLDPAKRRSLVC